MSSTARRWYQLSMLQLLVAMAVVASLLVANLSIKRLVESKAIALIW